MCLLTNKVSKTIDLSINWHILIFFETPFHLLIIKNVLFHLFIFCFVTCDLVFRQFDGI